MRFILPSVEYCAKISRICVLYRHYTFRTDISSIGYISRICISTERVVAKGLSIPSFSIKIDMYIPFVLKISDEILLSFRENWQNCLRFMSSLVACNINLKFVWFKNLPEVEHIFLFIRVRTSLEKSLGNYKHFKEFIIILFGIIDYKKSIYSIFWLKINYL